MSRRTALHHRLRELIAAPGWLPGIAEGERVAVKVLVGEDHNITFLRPVLVRSVVEHITEVGASPFVTDTISLWPRSRFDTDSLLQTANRNGFSSETLGCPFEIADENGAANVHPKNSDLKSVEVAKGIYNADALVILNHVTLDRHGFGMVGALYNLGFGCTTQAGKALIHSPAKVIVNAKKCVACWACVNVCKYGALSIQDGIAKLDDSKCVRCGACATRCPKEAIHIRCDARRSAFYLIETARAVLQSFKPGKVVFVNFIMDITPNSDEVSYSEEIIIPNIGVASSTDPVALDSATSKMIRSSKIITDEHPEWKKTSRKVDMIKKVTGMEWRHALRCAEAVGMGKQRYKFVNI